LCFRKNRIKSEIKFISYNSKLPFHIKKLSFRIKEGTNINNVKKDFKKLPKDLKCLNMSSCWMIDFTDDVFKNLQNLNELDICNCKNITDSMFKCLNNLQILNMDMCMQKRLSDKMFSYLKNLKSLSMIACSQTTITNNAFKYLTKLEKLSISHCIQLTDEIFQYMPNLIEIYMNYCYQFSNKIFAHFQNLKLLSMAGCWHKSITYKSLQKLTNIIELDITSCPQISVNFNTFTNLKKLKKLFISHTHRNRLLDCKFKVMCYDIE